MTPIENPFNENHQELQDLQWLLHRKKLFLAFYMKVGYGDKFSYANFSLGSPRFYDASHLYTEAKECFSLTLMPQCNSCNSH